MRSSDFGYLVGPIEKVSKRSVDYSVGMGSKRCENCTYFEDGACRRVRGLIDPAYWCKLFRRA